MKTIEKRVARIEENIETERRNKAQTFIGLTVTAFLGILLYAAKLAREDFIAYGLPETHWATSFFLAVGIVFLMAAAFTGFCTLYVGLAWLFGDWE